MITEIDISILVCGVSYTTTVEVDYTYHKRILGAKEGGVPIDPDEPAWTEVNFVRDIELSNEQIRAIEEVIFEEEYGY